MSSGAAGRGPDVGEPEATGLGASGLGASGLAIRGLSKRYGAVTALADVDITVAPGELRGLLGPNGAGKTTLLRIVFGLAGADSGSVELGGRLAGFVEAPAFYPYLSGRRNLELLAALSDVDRTRVPAVLEQVALAQAGDARVAGYSTGMRQRLGIAAALLREPRVLALDEPTSGLDPAGAADTARLLAGLRERGAAILVSSHQISELENLCDSYTILREGRVIWDGTAADVASSPRRASPLQNLYFSLTG